MQKTKMSPANAEGKLSRAEMKNILAGYATTTGQTTCWQTKCDDKSLESWGYGKCSFTKNDHCTCSDGSCL